jgi:hypothetical protein
MYFVSAAISASTSFAKASNRFDIASRTSGVISDSARPLIDCVILLYPSPARNLNISD